ncbi:unnamed protein product, partial [Coregonus sp. 'balchen']
SFGDSKSQNTEVMRTLIQIVSRCDVCVFVCVFQIVSRCDVCLLQEVRDTKQKAMPLLMTALNRIGSVTVTDQYQYPDMLPGDEDAFSREPFIVRLHTPKT